MASTIMPSVGRPIELPTRIGRYERRMKRLQRAVARKRRGSANLKKAVFRLNACHGQIGAMRRDFLHQATTKLVAEHALIAIEDLAVRSMTGSAAGTVDEPGKNVRQKAGLNRSILDQAWGEARRQLDYKTAARGGAPVRRKKPARVAA